MWYLEGTRLVLFEDLGLGDCDATTGSSNNTVESRIIQMIGRYILAADATY